MEYVAGRSNLACTIFVPYDCDNNCPFCTSKKLYKNLKVDFDKIIKAILLVNDSSVIREFVITGGEPFANLELLKSIVNVCKKPIYINTTLPKKNLDNIIEFINSEEKIYGINISRQFGNYNNIYNYIAEPEEIHKIQKPIRINTIRTNNYIKYLDDFINKFLTRPNIILNLREDYRYITKENLKIRNEVVDYLADKFVYIGQSGCMICNGETFVNPQTDQFIHYHRGIEFSCVRLKSKTYINDIIICPNGKIYDDWDFKKELNDILIKNIK